MGDFEVFRTVCATRCVPMVWNVPNRPPKICAIGARVEAWAPKLENLTEFWNKNAPQGANPIRDFLRNLECLWAVPSFVNHLNSGIRSRDSRIMELNLGVHFPLNFSVLYSGELYVGCEIVFKVREWFGLLCHHALVGLGLRATPRGKRKSSMFFCSSITLLNDKVCERHFAISALEYGNDIGTFG